MSNNELMYKAAQALRQSAAAQKALETENDLYKDCIKVAFKLAAQGDIEDTSSAILNKAAELRENKDELPVVKKAMEMNNRYTPVGKVEKTASSNTHAGDDDVSGSDMEFLAELQAI